MVNTTFLILLSFLSWTRDVRAVPWKEFDGHRDRRSAASLGLVGDPADVVRTTIGGTAIIGGGTDVDEVFEWMINKTDGGDFVVIRASGTDAYNSYIYDLGPINSVETLLINSRTLANDPAVEKTLLDAEAIFISGGDQANYVNFWKNTKVHHALNYLRNVKQIPIGGTSAGCAILGGVYFGALQGTITSPEALSDPYIDLLTLGFNDFLDQPYLANVITDSHFDNRNRHGRLTTFLARMSQDKGMLPRGIGLDESAGVCIESNGIGKVYGTGAAYFLAQNTIEGTPETCVPGSPLDWYRNEKAVRVYRIAGTNDGSHIFNIDTWTPDTSATSMFYYAHAGVFNISY